MGLSDILHYKQPRIQGCTKMYREMDEKMESIQPGCDGLMAIGRLSGTVMPFDPVLKGVDGHTLSHKTEHFYGHWGESFGYALSGAIERMEAMYPEQSPHHRRRRPLRPDDSAFGGCHRKTL